MALEVETEDSCVKGECKCVQECEKEREGERETEGER